jgi:hypothetical protein
MSRAIERLELSFATALMRAVIRALEAWRSWAGT